MLKSDFEDYQQPYLERVIADGFLRVNDIGVVEMIEPAKIFIAGKLRENGYISYWHVAEPFRKVLDRLIAEGLLEVSDKLFTRDEVSYLNFHLNMKEFSDSKDLRNKYMHGSYGQDAKQQQVDYLYFLRTTILILIKLRDDAVLKRRWFSA